MRRRGGKENEGNEEIKRTKEEGSKKKKERKREMKIIWSVVSPGLNLLVMKKIIISSTVSRNQIYSIC